MASGVIYVIVNSGTGKYYLGSTTDYAKRISTHFSQLRAGTHHSILLQRSWNKWGEDYFSHYVLYETADLKKSEQLELDRMLEKEWGCTYNVSPAAGGGDLISNHPNREAILKKMAEAAPKGPDNKMWKDGRSRVCYDCPSCGGRKGRDAPVCMSCKKAAGWTPCPKKVRVQINGSVYESFMAAQRALGIRESTIRGRCKSSEPEFDNWRIVNERVSTDS